MFQESDKKNNVCLPTSAHPPPQSWGLKLVRNRLLVFHLFEGLYLGSLQEIQLELGSGCGREEALGAGTCPMAPGPA